MKLTSMMVFFIVGLLVVLATMATAAGPTGLADLFLIKTMKHEEGDALNVRKLEFSLQGLFIEKISTLNIDIDADIITLPEDPEEKIDCYQFNDPIETVATKNSLRFTVGAPVTYAFQIRCNNVKFDFNSQLNIMTGFSFSSPEYPEIDPMTSDYLPINESIEPRGDDLADDVSFDLTERKDAEGVTIKNTRFFSFSIKDSALLDGKVAFVWHERSIIQLNNPETPAEEIGCKINEDLIPALFDSAHRTLLFDFSTHAMPLESTFVLDCKDVFYIDFNNFTDNEIMMSLSIPGDKAAYVPFTSPPINDDITHGFYEEFEVELTPYDAEVYPDLRSVKITAKAPTGPLIPSTLTFATEIYIIKQISTEKPLVCLVNQQEAPVWIARTGSFFDIDISGLELIEGDLEITCPESLYLDFSKIPGRKFQAMISQPKIISRSASTFIGPIDDLGWFEQVTIDLDVYPDTTNPRKNARSFTINAIGATGAIGHEISIEFGEKIVAESEPETQTASCFINDSTEVPTVMESDNILLNIASIAITKGDTITISCNLYLDFSTVVGKDVLLTLQRPNTQSSVVVKIPGINDDDKPSSDLFESMSIELKVPVDQDTHQAIKNKRTAKFYAKKALVDITGHLVLTPSQKIITLSPSAALGCVDLARPDIEIPALFDEATGEVKMDLTREQSKISKDADFSFECNFHFNFAKFKGKATEVSMGYTESTSPSTVLGHIDPIDDEKNPPSELFNTFEVALRPLEDKTPNARHFTIIGSVLKIDFNDVIVFKLSNDLVVVTQTDPEPLCTWGSGKDQHSAPARGLTKGSFYVDFSTNPIAKGTENFQLSCTQIYFNFKSVRALVVQLQATTNDDKHILSVANMGPVNDDDTPGEVVWPMVLKMPIRSKYQSFVSLNIDNLPTHRDTGTNQLLLDVTLVGIDVNNHQTHNNGTLHYVTVTSYASDKADEKATVSGFSLTNISPTGVITPFKVNFPEGHVKLSVDIQVATHQTQETVKAVVHVVGNQRSYRPDEKSTLTAWNYNDSIFDFTLPKNATATIKTTFGAYLGDKKKGNYGPSFEFAFPKTSVGLKDHFITLYTNTTVPLVDNDTPAFFFNNKTKQPSCTIPQFNHVIVPVEKDQYGKSLTFNLTGVKKLEKSGESFTLKCDNFGIIVNDKEHPESQPISFTLSSTIGDQRYSNSWVNTPQKNSKTSIGLIVVGFLIALAVVAGVYFGVKKYRESSAQADNQPLLGEIQ